MRTPTTLARVSPPVSFAQALDDRGVRERDRIGDAQRRCGLTGDTGQRVKDLRDGQERAGEDIACAARACSAARIMPAATSRGSTTFIPPGGIPGIVLSREPRTSRPLSVGAASPGPNIQPGIT